MKYIAYLDGGDIYLGDDFNLQEAKALVCQRNPYALIGQHFDRERGVLCGFKEVPDDAEIIRRRANGFLGARLAKL